MAAVTWLFGIVLSCLCRSSADTIGVANRAFKQGNEAFQAGDSSRAAFLWRRALAANPVHGPAIANLAVLEYHSGNHDAAFELYERALSREPTRIDIIGTFCGALSSLGNFSSAVSLVGDLDRTCTGAGCLMLFTNIAKALKHDPLLETQFGLAGDHRYFMTRALKFVEANLNLKCTGKIPQRRFRLVTCWECEARRSSLLSVSTLVAELRPGMPYSVRNAVNGLEHPLQLSATTLADAQTMSFRERRSFHANFTAVRVHASSDGEVILHHGSRIYLRLNDQLPSQWWQDSQHGWVMQITSKPFSRTRLHNESCYYVKEVACIAQRWGTNYYHFFTECLSRLVGMRKLLLENPSLPLLLPKPQRATAFIQETLDLLALPNPLIYQEEPGYLCADHLYTVDWVPVPEDTKPDTETKPPASLLRIVRRVMNSKISSSTLPSSRVIYISRGSAANRQIINEQRLIDAVNSSLPPKFELHIFTGPFHLNRTIELFSRATLVIGIHGAGLTNMIFMPPGSMVLELALPEPCFRDYLHLAAALGHDYHYVILPMNVYANAVVVDVNEVKTAVMTILRS